ncbi:hypothetical protein, partial [Romboutsia sp. 1001216sp1]
MTFKKRVTKSMALALIGVTISTPILNTASAMENATYGLSNDKIIELKKQADEFNENTSMEELYSEDQIKLMKIEFHEMFGNENEFKEVYSENNIKLEINGYTGDMRATVEGEEPIVTNYFDGIEYIKNSIHNSKNEAEPFYSLSKHYRSSGPDQSYLKVYVQSGKSNILIARNTKGNTKTYYKSASSWNSGNTSALRQEIESAKNNWDKASKALNSAGVKTLWNLLAGY